MNHLRSSIPLLLPLLLAADVREVASREGANVQRPTWSHDGKSLAYEANFHEQKRIELYVGDPQGGRFMRIVPTVRVLTLPDLPPKGDLSDWLDADGTVGDLRWLAEEALRRPASEPAAPESDGAGDEAAGDHGDDGALPAPAPFPVDALPVTAVHQQR